VRPPFLRSVAHSTTRRPHPRSRSRPPPSLPARAQELWNIFTFYTLHGNPLDPEHIRASQFVKLAKDTQIVGASGLTEADVNVVYTAEVTQLRASGDAKRKMNFNDFLTALMKLSVRVYPRAKTVDDAFQQLLMDNILPSAARRCPDAVEMFLENEDVRKLFDYYRDALEQIFSFYATSDKRTAAVIAKPGYGASTGAVSFSGRSPSRAAKSVNSMKGALGYNEFLKLAADFDLSNSVILSTIEIGDIYLSSIKAIEPDSTIRKLAFLEFWEALVRCALVAYSKISGSTVIDKIRGLFLYMWRSMHRSVPMAFADRRNISTYAGDLLAGAMLFNKRFTAQWLADGRRDYLSPDPRVQESGKVVLKRLGVGPLSAASRSGMGALAPTAAFAGAGAGAGADDGDAPEDDYGYGGAGAGAGAGAGSVAGDPRAFSASGGADGFGALGSASGEAPAQAFGALGGASAGAQRGYRDDSRGGGY